MCVIVVILWDNYFLENHMKKTDMKKGFRIGDLSNAQDVEYAASIISNGGIISMRMRGVCGMWVDATSQQAVFKVCTIKADNPNRKLSTMVFAENILPLVDVDSVYPDLRKYVQDTNLFKSVFGSICHICLPILPSKVDKLPASIYSIQDTSNGPRPVVYNLEPTGHELMSHAVSSYQARGVLWSAVTTLNAHGAPEPTNDIQAIHMIEKYNATSADKSNPPILIYLKDTTRQRSDIVGSFAQLNFITGEIMRDGHIPSYIIERIVPARRSENMLPHKYPNVFPDTEHWIGDDKSPSGIRKSIIQFIENNVD